MKNYFVLSILSILLLTNCGDASKETKSPSSTLTGQEQANTSSPVKPIKTNAVAKKRVVFFGNSLTAGYGLDPDQSFTSLIQNRIDSLLLDYEVINAGLSGETTAGGASRIDWILKQPIDVFVLELGGNDGLRGIAPENSFKNLQAIISKVKAKSPTTKIVLAGMEAPPNMGEDFTTAFRAMYPKLAKANDTYLIPFLLENVGGIPKLNQPDGIHPTAEGNIIITETIWKILKEVL